jgi:hypothetical protein
MSDNKLRDIELCKRFAEDVLQYEIQGVSNTGVPIMLVPTGDTTVKLEVTKLITNLITVIKALENLCKCPRADRPWITLRYYLEYNVIDEQETYTCKVSAHITDRDLWRHDSNIQVTTHSLVHSIMYTAIEIKKAFQI